MKLSWKAFLGQAGSSYVTVATTVLSTLVLFVIANLIAARTLPDRAADFRNERERLISSFIQRHGIETLRATYPGMSDDRIRELLMATGVVGNRYYPYVDFINEAFVSSDLLIRPEGYRIIGREQAAWPPPKADKIVFVFGASTTLGSGVADDQTIPAYIQRILRANFKEKIDVYNFGMGSYYSTQEVLLFYDWLRKGVQPDLAIFIDGANETAFYDDRSSLSGFFQSSYEKLKASDDPRNDISFVQRLKEITLALPLVRALSSLPSFGSAKAAEADPKGQPPRTALDPQRLKIAEEQRIAYLQRPASEEENRTSKTVLDRYLVNMRAATGIGSAFGVETFFSWQPAPLYKFDLHFHPFDIVQTHQMHRVSYPMMYQRYVDGLLPRNFGWCADIQEGRRQQLYVDQMHYQPVLAQLMAQCTTQKAVASGVFDRLGWTRVSDAFTMPDVSQDFDSTYQSGSLELAALITRKPEALSYANVSLSLPDPADPAKGKDVAIIPVGNASEHYLTISTRQADTGDRLLIMNVAGTKTNRLRIQAWDAQPKPSGVIADVRLDDDTIKTRAIEAGQVLAAEVVRRTGFEHVTLRIRLPGGVSKLLIQPLKDDGVSTFSPEGEAIVVKRLVLQRAPD